MVTCDRCVQSKDGASEVTVVAPADADVAGFGSDFVRVQGLASTLRGGRAVVLQEGGAVFGGVVACPPMHAASRKLAQAACGGGGQPVCTGAQLDGAFRWCHIAICVS